MFADPGDWTGVPSFHALSYDALGRITTDALNNGGATTTSTDTTYDIVRNRSERTCE